MSPVDNDYVKNTEWYVYTLKEDDGLRDNGFCMFVMTISILCPDASYDATILLNVRIVPLRVGEVVTCDPRSIEYK